MVPNRQHLAGGVVCGLRLAPHETLIRRQMLTTLVPNRQLLAAGGVFVVPNCRLLAADRVGWY